MVLCGCKKGRCSCRLGSGLYTEVVGNGSDRNPYEVNLTERTLTGQATPSAEVEVTGSGVGGDPWVVEVNLMGGAANQQVFTSSGTWVKPPTGTVAQVVVIGGGGGGGNAGGSQRRGGGGGSGGAMSTAWFLLADLPDAVAVEVGAGGAGAVRAGPDQAGSGGRSTFGEYLLADGGVGGRQQQTSPPGPSVTVGGTHPDGGQGGAGGGWTASAPSGSVRPPDNHDNTPSPTGGGVGSGHFVGGQTPGGTIAMGTAWAGTGGDGALPGGDGQPGNNYGGGGGGGASSATTYGPGGAGAPGVVVVTIW